MGLTMGQRKALTREMAARYRGARRPQEEGDARRVRRTARLHPPPRRVVGWSMGPPTCAPNWSWMR